MAGDLGHKVFKNVFFLFAGRAWGFALSILLTPYLLSRLGNDVYGIWVLVGALVSYIGLSDFGFGTSFVKYVAEYDTRGDREGVNGVMSTGIIFYLAIAIVLLTLSPFIIGATINLLAVPERLRETTRTVLLLGIITLLWANFIQVYQSVINGLQRMDVTIIINVSLSLCYALGCVAVLESGFGILGLALAHLIPQIIGVGVSAYYAYRLYAGLEFKLNSIKRHWVTLFRYGINLLISNIASLITFQFDKLLVNRFINAAHVTFYDVGSRPSVTARSFAVLLLSSLTPATSALEVQQGREKLYQLFVRASKYVSALAFPLFTGMIVASRPIIEAWVGQGYESSVVVMRILCIGYLFHIFAAPVSPFVQGMGRPDYQRNAEALTLILNIGLSIALIRQYGFYGAPVGTAIATFVSSVYYLWSFHRFMGRPLLSFLKGTYLKPFLCAAVSGGLIFMVIGGLTPFVAGGRLASLLVVGVAVVVMVAIYPVLLLKSRYFDEGDADLLKRFVSIRWLRPS